MLLYILPINCCVEKGKWYCPILFEYIVSNYSRGQFHKTSLPNKPGLFQLVWLILNQTEINLAYLVNLFYETGSRKCLFNAEIYKLEPDELFCNGLFAFYAW